MSDRASHQTFAAATCDEIWFADARPRLAERRATCGEAVERDGIFLAADAKHPHLIEEAEVLAKKVRQDALAAAADFDCRMRIIATAREVAGVRRTDAIVISTTRMSVVSEPPTLGVDLDLLRELSSRVATDDADLTLPLVWRRGSAAVLFHEAVAHPAEHCMPPLAWPAWLSIIDEPAFTVDDCGHARVAVDLLEDAPRSWRRDTFREIPRQRMSRVVAQQDGAPFELPARYIEVDLASGGSYDPLTDVVVVHVVAAREVSAGAAKVLRPFQLRASRAAIAASLLGADGAPERCPGVICSSEGHETYVASSAPVIVSRLA